jgi:hypothetical protein
MDHAELAFDFGGITEFRDLETGERLVTDPRAVRREYLEALNGFLTGVREGCRRQTIDHELLDTARPFDAALTAYLGRRARVR